MSPPGKRTGEMRNGTASPPISDLHPEVREVVDALIAALGDDLAALLWHGSFARGEARPDSDHDLVIILKRIDDTLLRRLQDVFRGRASWSTFVQSEEELRQYPLHGRLQFSYGARLLYGSFEPPSVSREHILDEIRSLARDIRFECRYRLLHREPEYAEMEEHLRDFQRTRNLRMLFYAAKLAVLALKARERLHGRPYPSTRADLRDRLTDAEDIAVVDLVENWPQPRDSYPGDITDLALQLDAFARRIVARLPTPTPRKPKLASRNSAPQAASFQF